MAYFDETMCPCFYMVQGCSPKSESEAWSRRTQRTTTSTTKSRSGGSLAISLVLVVTQKKFKYDKVGLVSMLQSK